MIYIILPGKFKRDDRKNQDWIPSADLYNEYKQSNEPFKILLIGLNGRVKLRQSEFLSNEDLFGRIDQMPMRWNELEKRGHSTREEEYKLGSIVNDFDKDIVIVMNNRRIKSNHDQTS